MLIKGQKTDYYLKYFFINILSSPYAAPTLILKQQKDKSPFSVKVSYAYGI